MTGLELARAAEALVGAPFRLHGRDPATGLDCIGLLAAALGVDLPNGYRLRSRALPDLSAIAEACGFIEAGGATEPGDVIMTRVGPCQFHLLIAAAGDGFVHAHAGVGRVVRRDAPLDWPVVRRWRLFRPSSSGEGQRDLGAQRPSRSGVGSIGHTPRPSERPHPNPSPEGEGLQTEDM